VATRVGKGAGQLTWWICWRAALYLRSFCRPPPGSEWPGTPAARSSPPAFHKSHTENVNRREKKTPRQITDLKPPKNSHLFTHYFALSAHRRDSAAPVWLRGAGCNKKTFIIVLFALGTKKARRLLTRSCTELGGPDTWRFCRVAITASELTKPTYGYSSFHQGRLQSIQSGCKPTAVYAGSVFIFRSYGARTVEIKKIKHSVFVSAIAHLK